eukprot:1113489-Pelagomonas_calceolata.AAC.1
MYLDVIASALELAALEVQLAHNSHAILVVQPTKVAAAVAHPPPGDGYLDKATSKSARHVATADMSAYVSVVRRLQQVAAPARDSKAGTDSIAQLEALKKKQAFGHTGMHEHQTRLALLYANAVAHKVLGGAEGIRSWVDVHISRNPMLLSQLKGYAAVSFCNETALHLSTKPKSHTGALAFWISAMLRSKHEVYNHYIPAQQVKGELLQLDVVLCHVSKEQEAGPALVIGLHLQERDMEPNEVPVQASLQPRVQQQQHAQKVGMRRARFRGSKSLDLTHAGQLRRPGLNSEDVSMGGSTSTQQQQQQHQQQHLYLALSHLPVAVTLISSCGCITWQNGRQVQKGWWSCISHSLLVLRRCVRLPEKSARKGKGRVAFAVLAYEGSSAETGKVPVNIPVGSGGQVQKTWNSVTALQACWYKSQRAQAHVSADLIGQAACSMRRKGSGSRRLWAFLVLEAQDAFVRPVMPAHGVGQLRFKSMMRGQHEFQGQSPAASTQMNWASAHGYRPLAGMGVQRR